MTHRSIFALILVATLTFACSQKIEASCVSDIGNEKYTLDTCTEANGVAISIFSDSDIKSPNATVFDKLKVGVATSLNKIALERTAGIDPDKKHQYGFLISVPAMDDIVSRSPLPAEGIKKLTVDGWTTTAELITYAGQGDDDDQFVLVCGTSLASNRDLYTAVAKCMPFYPQDIKEYHSILEYIKSHQPRK